MNGAIRPYAMSTPLTSPHAAPTASAANTMTIQWMSSAMVCVATVVHHTDASATMAPTDRSMPPPMMTNVMPTLTTPMTDASRRIVSMLSMSAKRSPAVTTPTIMMSARAATRPRLRPTELAMMRPTVDCGSAAVAAAAASIRRCSSGGGIADAPAPCGGVVGVDGRGLVAHAAVPSITRSSTRCSSISVCGAFVDHSALAQDEHAVGQPEDLGDLAADQEDGHTVVGELADHCVELGPGSDVDPAGRLVEQEHVAALQQPTGEDDLLLVTAGQGADLAQRRWAAGRPGSTCSSAAFRSAARRTTPLANRAGTPA